jgi:hypothetical protein
MVTEISRTTRAELITAVRARYRTAGRYAKVRILDELVALTGHHRKHLIRILNQPERAISATPRTPRRIYDEAVREALRVMWEASDRICGKRLKALLPVLLPALERCGHVRLDVRVRQRLLEASAATIDRVLAPTRAAIRGRPKRAARAGASVRRGIAVRTFADWKDLPSGFMEVDLVAHCGGAPAGNFVHTMTLTDVASGWTECVALLVRDGGLVTEALAQLRTRMPFPLLGIDTDNGSEFINETVARFCCEQGIEFSRSRPHRKNDQAWVEQKNGSIVRRMVGYGRLEGAKAAQVLARLYDAVRLFVNFFQPSFRLAIKVRDGAKVAKRYHAPETPCARLLASDTMADAMKERLRSVADSLDPLALLDEIRTAQQVLASMAAGEPSHLPQRRERRELDEFLQGLASAWRHGEVRPTHKPPTKAKRYWRTRLDPFEAVWPTVETSLAAEPDITAKALFERLQAAKGSNFSDGQLRTLQRRVQAWRREMARRLVFEQHQGPVEAGATAGVATTGAAQPVPPPSPLRYEGSGAGSRPSRG